MIIPLRYFLISNIFSIFANQLEILLFVAYDQKMFVAKMQFFGIKVNECIIPYGLIVFVKDDTLKNTT